jgi:hypothetical protein
MWIMSFGHRHRQRKDKYRMGRNMFNEEWKKKYRNTFVFPIISKYIDKYKILFLYINFNYSQFFILKQ